MKIDIKEYIDKVNDVIAIMKGLISIVKELWAILLVVFSLFLGLSNSDQIKQFLISHNILSINVVNFIASNSNGILSLFLLLLIIILVCAIRKVGKRAIKLKSTTYDLIYQLHNEFSHILRNGIYDLYLAKEKIEMFKQENNKNAIKELQSHAFDNIVNNLQSFVDLIADFLSSYRDDTISVCIKVINSGQENIKDDEKQAKTLVRSKNTKRNRKRSNENITVGKNSDFVHLCDSTNIWYKGIDLKTMYDKGTYANEIASNDWQMKYNSTIVVPIRYKNTTDDKIYFDVLGFLCIDSKKVVKEWDKCDPEPLELHYLAIFADSIYTYIKLFRRIFDNEEK